MNKQDISILVGNLLDHFDTALYGFLAPVLATYFFPHAQHLLQLILTYSIFATSILTRLLGGYIFSCIAKKHNPILALSYSLKGVAIATLTIGLIPSYQTIGWVAPLLLIATRMVQSICAEGESSIARLYLLEKKKEQQAFTASSLYEVSTMLGIIIASLLSTIIISTNHHAYWRCCFIGGGISTMANYNLRRRNTIPYKEILGSSHQGSHIKPLLPILWSYRWNVLRVAIAFGFSYMTYSVPFIVMNSFIPLITPISLITMMTFNTWLLILDIIMMPCVAFFIRYYLVKKYDYKTLLLIISSILSITIIPLWVYLKGGTLLYITCVRLWIIFWGVGFSITLNLWINDLFPPADKYILTSLGNALGSSLLGKLTPTICFTLFYMTNTYWSMAVYIATMALLTMVGVGTSTVNKILEKKREYTDD